MANGSQYFIATTDVKQTKENMKIIVVFVVLLFVIEVLIFYFIIMIPFFLFFSVFIKQ